MRLEVPVCKRCCCCLPLRHGLIVWGYFKLFIASLAMVILIKDWRQIFEGKNDGSITPIIVDCIATVLVTLDIILVITLLVGCHMKNVKVIKIFFFYSQILLALLTILGTHQIIWSISQTLLSGGDVIWLYRLMDAGVLFASIAVQIYILLLVRSEIIKIDSQYQFTFVNRAVDAECILDTKQVGQVNPEEYGKC